MKFKGQKSEKIYNKLCKVSKQRKAKQRRNNKVLSKHVRYNFNLIKVQYRKLLRPNSMVLSRHLREMQFNESVTR